MGHTNRRFPQYSPASDGALTMWLDPSDSSKLVAVGGGGITNGATIQSFATSGGTARSFTQWGANARPTWESAGINGLGCVRHSTQILTTSTVTGFATMTSLAVACVVSRVAAGGCAMSTSTGDNSLVQLFVDNTYGGGGRRVNADTFQSQSGSSAPTTYVLGISYDYSNAKITIVESGRWGVRSATFQASGTADTPQEISIGGFAQQTGSSMAGTSNGRTGESLWWAKTAGAAMTPDDLVPAMAYLCRKWGGGLL